jgi:hypothetical protein
VRAREADAPVSSGTHAPDAASESDEDEDILREAYTEVEPEEVDDTA